MKDEIVVKTPRHSVLIVDDEQESLECLTKILSDKEFNVLTAENGEVALRVAKESLPSVILLDIQMPKMNGLDVCHELRTDEATKHIPIIIISGSDDKENQIRSFVEGADDFIEKPYKMKELIARLNSKVRRLDENKVKEQIVVCGNLTLDSLKIEAKVDNKVVEMSALEFKLLKFFVDHKDQVLSRDRILNAVWNTTHVTRRTIDTHLCCLKSKLYEFNYEFTSVYGKGYILKTDQNVNELDEVA